MVVGAALLLHLAATLCRAHLTDPLTDVASHIQSIEDGVIQEPSQPTRIISSSQSTVFTYPSSLNNNNDDRFNYLPHGDLHEMTPYFYDHTNATNVTAQLGSTAFMNCRVNRLRDKTVSWVRREDVEIKLLTWGLHTYSNDARYSLNFEHPNNWKLQVKYTQRRDAGLYECQVSTHPPKVLIVRLNIVAPVVEIIDERGANVHEKFYKTGSTIELKCTISQMPQAQTFILWRHGEHMLNYDTSRGGISVKTDMSSSVIVSTLFIANATPRDSGNYTCSLGDVATGSVHVHILNGEHPAAMQAGSGTKDLCSTTLVLILSFVVLVLNLCSTDVNSLSPIPFFVPVSFACLR